MKKILAFTVTSILLGVVTMVAPLVLLKPSYYDLITSGDRENLQRGSPEFYAALDGSAELPETLGEGDATFGEATALERAVSPANLASTGLILAPSFLLAFGVFLCLRKRMQ